MPLAIDIARPSASAAEPMAPQPYRVSQVRRETADTVTLTLHPKPTGAPCRFEPGQFNMLYAFGVGEVPISHSGDPYEAGIYQHTVRVVGAVTKALCAVKKDDVIGVRGPFGSAWPLAAARGRDILLVAGGIGLAPLRPVLISLLHERDRYGRVVLLCGTRTPDDLLFRREMNRWRGRFDAEVHVTVDRAARGWRGHVGVVTTLIQRAHLDPTQTAAMVCGPEVMLHFTIRELRTLGVSEAQIYISMERNMKCAVGFCGHCQFGPLFMCKDGPVLRLDRVQAWLRHQEI